MLTVADQLRIRQAYYHEKKSRRAARLREAGCACILKAQSPGRNVKTKGYYRLCPSTGPNSALSKRCGLPALHVTQERWAGEDTRMAEKTVWGIHGGKMGDADILFRQKNCIALGWSRVSNLSQLPATREAFKERLVQHYPDKKPGAVPVEAGQLFRFVHEMRDGDYVVYPSSVDRQIHIGQVKGPYEYHPGPDLGYPHRRPVKWLRSVPRTRFTQGALYETGSAMSFFQVRNYADEFLAALEGTLQPQQPATEDETVALVVEDIELTTADFIHKQLAKELKGHAFADFVAHLLERMGYRVRVSPPGPDTGIDIVAHKDELGFESPFIKVQVKSGEGSISAPDVQALYGNIDNS